MYWCSTSSIEFTNIIVIKFNVLAVYVIGVYVYMRHSYSWGSSAYVHGFELEPGSLVMGNSSMYNCA